MKVEVEVVVGVAGISERYHGRLMGVNCRGTGGRVRLRVANAARFTLCHVDDGGARRRLSGGRDDASVPLWTNKPSCQRDGCRGGGSVQRFHRHSRSQQVQRHMESLRN